MPGIIGHTCRENTDALAKMEKRLRITPHIQRTAAPAFPQNLSVYSLKGSKQIISDKKHILAFEGYITNTIKRGEKLLSFLLESFISKGETFVSDLRGSFVIAICYRERNKWLIFADQTASRPMFFSVIEDDLYFSPEVAPLLTILQAPTLNKGSLFQFMISGYFFSGSTLFEQINLLRPGEYISYQNSKISLKRYYSYKVESGSIHSKSAIKRLNQVLGKTIETQWEYADSPAVLLSGGYDSRYIMLSIAEIVDDTSKITAVSWGQNPEKSGSDIVIAKTIAKRLGCRHIVMDRTDKDFKSQFEEMFYAQSGMTDASFYHAQEMTICSKLREKYGITSLFRGDECFGFGQKVFRFQNSLRTILMSFPEYVTTKEWLSSECREEFTSDFSKKLNSRIDERANPNDLKDTLYFNERLTMALHPLNYFKYGYLDVFLPLLDVDALEIVRGLPNRLRNDKEIFKRCLSERFPKFTDIPYAKENNLFDWGSAVAQNSELCAYLREQINALPPLLDVSFLEKQLERCLIPNNDLKQINIKALIKRALPQSLVSPAATIAAGMKDKSLDLPPLMLIFRAAVLARWFKLWLSE